MSAIWGAIDLSGNTIGEEIKKIMRGAFTHCRIDRYEEIHKDNVYMGCGIQYFVPEAEKEQLPYGNEGIYFTADAVLDNRKELTDKLGITADSDQMPDGEILFMVYKQFGKKCLNDLLGAYSFVWYDRKENKVEFIADAVGNRFIYYTRVEDTIYFASLMEPLRTLVCDRKLNDRWIADFLAMDHLFMVNETEETPVKDIYRIAPAQYIEITPKQIKKEIYWKPFDDYKPYPNKSDEEFKKEFRELWDHAVKDVMRGTGETAIMLSGGLDSTAVAAVAAPCLKQQGKTLYSFTAVPMGGYQNREDEYYVDDETEDVKKTAQYYGNIETDFIDLDGKTPWELIDGEFQIQEIPFKSIQNCLWLTEGMKRAYNKGARLMLSGSYGNTSISFTNLNVYMNTLYHEHKYFKLRKEVQKFADNMGFSAKYALRQIRNENKEVYEETTYPYGNSYIRRDLARQLDCRNRIDKFNKDNDHNLKTFERYRHLMVNYLAMRQIGELSMKRSIVTGVLLRDPTRDKRIIEFCIHLPMEQFCKEGIDRRLVKVYLKDIMPQHVFSFSKQGRQSADLKYRMEKHWDKIRLEWIAEYEKYSGSKYVDTVYAKRQLTEQTQIDGCSVFDLTRHMYTLLVLKYENAVQKVSADEPDKALISIIIPVHNSEKYLTQCIDSVRKQTYTNLEIILVDDNSSDGSEKICDEFAGQDARISVLHRNYNCVSDARNAGLEIAKGSYIGFVDSDDWIEEDMYARLYEIIREQQADLAICSFKRILENKVQDYADGRVVTLYGNEIIDSYVTGNNRCLFSPAVWNRLYRREIIGMTRFPDLHAYEDSVFNDLVMLHAQKAVYINRTFYNYRIQKSSLSHQDINDQNIDEYISSWRSREKNIISHLRKSSQDRQYFISYCLLLDMYCKGKRTQKENRKVKCLKDELHRIRKEARKGIRQKEDIRRNEKFQLLCSTYTVDTYLIIEKARAFYHKVNLTKSNK